MTINWTRAAFVVLLAATAALYLWGLGESGWANSFYSAAVQAGSESWKAFFFGSSDASNAITVDKTPLSLWPMALSVKVFGLSSWSILVPQAIEGVATVALVHHLVRRTTGSAVAGLVAGAVLALTPVAVLMFRFNNPDALLVLLLTAAAGATLEAIERPGRAVRWLVLAGALVGLAFLTKMLQAFLVLPAVALVYLLCARVGFGRRIAHLLAALAAVVASAGWWLAIVSLWPAASRPYIGGSQHNSILELTLGYNGFGRLNGNETGSVGGGGPGGGGMWGATGIGRLFDGEIGGQVAWLLPAALVLGLAGLWSGWANRRLRAALLLWSLTLVSTWLTFSFMAGIFHAYYTVALAPSIGALVGIGGWALWQNRASLLARLALAATTAGTAMLAFVVLDRSADFVPWLRYAVVLAGFAGAALLLGMPSLPRRFATLALATALLAGLAGPAAYAVQTAGTPHTGSIPTAGPTVTSGFGPGGGFRAGPPNGGLPNGGLPNGGPPPGMQPAGLRRPAGNAGSAGGLLDGSTSSTAIDELLTENAGDYTWVAAAVGSNVASGYQLATEEPVMAIGGFNGSDPSPTLARFQEYVAAGKIHWFIGGGGGMGGGMGPGGGTSSAIASWVAATFTATTVDGITLYDLSGGVS
ncbi:MAG: glycosyltransferase family 39 protein [Nocardioidaceae bacterium]|nr:glycosyltransferase family 39 protein [Nocardioidaceae bacterium]